MNSDSLFWLMIGAVLATCFMSLGTRCLRHFSRHNLEEVCRRQQTLELIGLPALGIGEVARRVGYHDPASSSRVFRKWTGLAPRAFRTLLTNRG